MTSNGQRRGGACADQGSGQVATSARSRPLPLPPEAALVPVTGDRTMELWISRVLRAGVLLAGAVIALGLVLGALRGPAPGEATSLADLQARGGTPVAVHPRSLLHDAFTGQGSAVVEVGVLLLILTPVARVAMTLALFLAERDRVFVAITAIVLGVLVLGLLGIGA